MKKVLIADDNQLVIQFLRVSLEKIGAHIISVENGEMAVLLSQSDHFDLVILDNDMPKMDGLCACKEISRHCPVFIYSGEDLQEDALAAGATRFLSKNCPDVALLVIKHFLLESI